MIKNECDSPSFTHIKWLKRFLLRIQAQYSVGMNFST